MAVNHQKRSVKENLMDTEGAKRLTNTKIENSKKEFDMQLDNLFDRLKKSKKIWRQLIIWNFLQI